MSLLFLTCLLLRRFVFFFLGGGCKDQGCELAIPSHRPPPFLRFVDASGFGWATDSPGSWAASFSSIWVWGKIELRGP